MNYYCSKDEILQLISRAAEIGYIKGLIDHRKMSEYISQNQAYNIFKRTRVCKWVSDGRIVPKYTKSGKTSTILYNYLKLKELDCSDEIKIKKLM